MVILLIGVLLCSLCFSVVGAAGDSRVAETQPAPYTTVNNVETESFEAEQTIFIITVYEDGSAEWRFRYEQRLETETEVDDFETYAERFNTEETESFQNFRDRADGLTASGSNATDREMSAEAFHRSARIEERPPAGDEFGIVEMSFNWTEFAVIEDEQVVVGDVFVDGLYIGPDQQLRFERGPNLQFESASPEPNSTTAENLSASETITWVGERSFTDRQPRVVFVERDSTVPATEEEPNEASNGSNGPSDPTSGDTTGSMLPLAAVGIVILLGLSAAFAYRSGWFPPTATKEWGRRSRNSATDQKNSLESITGVFQADTSKTSDTPRDDQQSGESPPNLTDKDLLSDEEQVVKLLEAQGGRMKQVEIVNQTDWSKSKVSMLLSEMESEGTISKLRVGRENIVSLAGHEPDAAGSPFENM